MRCFSKLATLMLLLVFLVEPCSCMTLDEYSTRLQELRAELSDVLEGQEANFSKIKKILPLKVIVESEKKRFEINNEWLFNKLEEIKTAKEPERRNEIVLETIEIIDAVLVEIKKIQSAVESNVSKDETKRKLQEILSQPDYAEPREPEQSWIERKIIEFLEWLERRLPNNPFPRESSIDSTANLIARVLIYVIIGILAIFLFFWIRAHFVVRNRQELERSEERVILGERLSERDTPKSLFSEAERLASEGNLRQAIRKGYIALLFGLAQQRVLRFSKNKTNRDYLREIGLNSSIYPNVSEMTEKFERVWYGFTEPKVEDWEDFRAKYLQTLKTKESNSRS